MTDTRYKFGMVVTVIYAFALGTYAYLQRGPVMAMTPNEFGDALAGAASPLAFLWLVLGYLQQGEELRQNTEALHLQAKELQNSVEQQTQLVETSKLQLAVERERHAEATKRAANALLPGFVVTVQKADQDGENKNYKIQVRNVGAKCTGLTVTFMWTDNFSSSQEVGAVDSFGEFSVSIAWPHFAIEPRQITFLLQYYILQGGIRSTVIPMEFYWVAPGLMFLRERDPVHVHGPSP